MFVLVNGERAGSLRKSYSILRAGSRELLNLQSAVSKATTRETEHSASLSTSFLPFLSEIIDILPFYYKLRSITVYLEVVIVLK